MDFESDWLSELPSTFLDEWDSPVEATWEQTRNDLPQADERLPLSWYWTLRLAEAFELGGGAGGGRPLPPGFLWSSIGLVQESESSLGHFGIVLYVDSRVQLPGEYLNLPPLSLGREQFPMVVRAVALEDHRSVSAPRSGTVSLAKTRAGGTYERFGWLTAAHVVEGAQEAYYEDGSRGAILDRGPGCIDVALIEDTTLAPPSTVIPIQKAVTYGMAGSFTGQSGSHPVTVTDVSTSLGVLNASALPVRVGLSNHGVGGDLGSRVDATDGSAIGVYLGKYIDATGNNAGLAQMAEQVRVLIGLQFVS